MNQSISISIGEAAKILGVTVSTVRSWEKQGLIISERTPKGHRRYNLEKTMAQVKAQPIKKDNPTEIVTYTNYNILINGEKLPVVQYFKHIQSKKNIIVLKKLMLFDDYSKEDSFYQIVIKNKIIEEILVSTRVSSGNIISQKFINCKPISKTLEVAVNQFCVEFSVVFEVEQFIH
jgi:hypothetical protein